MQDATLRVMSPAAETLRVYYPQGSVVSVLVVKHRQTRAGTSQTTLAVVARTTSDHTVGNVSGMVADVTGNGVVGGTHGEPSRVIVLGYGNAEHAARALVNELARLLYGSSTALRPAVI